MRRRRFRCHHQAIRFSWGHTRFEGFRRRRHKVIGLDVVMLGKFLQLCKRGLMISTATVFCILVPLHKLIGSRRVVTNTGAVVELDMLSPRASAL